MHADARTVHDARFKQRTVPDSKVVGCELKKSVGRSVMIKGDGTFIKCPSTGTYNFFGGEDFTLQSD